MRVTRDMQSVHVFHVMCQGQVNIMNKLYAKHRGRMGLNDDKSLRILVASC
uniref:Uncharacterized protein n=1 Tax=Arundo donax TaxID=35708 RepID=A0A0A9GZ81_ARUDO